MTAVSQAPRGRSASGNVSGRYEELRREAFDDGWGEEPAPRQTATQVEPNLARRLISYNQSPDVPFDRSINPYRGCEHGCIYCYARPSHAYLGLSPGLDFETRLFNKPNAVELLRQELSRPGYRAAPIGLGANTDCYQPIERSLRLTRSVIEVLAEFNHPLMVVTKGALVERDIDLLAPMAARGLAQVHVSVTTLDRELSRRMEPRATAPHRRLQTIARLSQAGIPTGVLVAPVIPMLNDAELETILGQAHGAGANAARYSVLRLPLELDELFEQWMIENYPLKTKRVLSRVEDLRGGKRNDSRFGIRMQGTGTFATLLKNRFDRAHARLDFIGLPPLDQEQFAAPTRQGEQLQLL